MIQATKTEAETSGTASVNCRSTRLPTLACPVCQHATVPAKERWQWVCPTCRFQISERMGIFQALPAERLRYYRQFIQEYETVRNQESRGATSAAFYLELPYKDLTGANRWQWKIRARTFDCLMRRVLPAIERSHASGCDVLDLGAGNCWFSYQMSLRGHHPVAVDLLENDTDGLGAAKHYSLSVPDLFPRFVAEMDHLPFASSQFDLVVFNAAFHYSVDYSRTLSEAIRCLRRPGCIVIADSPLYSQNESGQIMVREKHAAFQKQFGFRSDSIRSLEFLTPTSLSQMAQTFSLSWNIVTPWYGLSWALRPWKARLLGRREPSRFQLIWAEVK